MDTETLTPVLAGVARHALTTLGGVLVADGVIQQADLNTDVGAGMVLLGIGWSWWQKRGQAQVAAMLKKMTATSTAKAAVSAARVLPPAAAVDTPVKAASVKSVMSVLVVVAALSALLAFPGGAHAASASKQPASIADAVQNMIDTIQKKDAQVVANVITALQEADADAAIVVVPANGTTPAQVKDPISHACYPAEIQYLQSLPTAQAIKVPPPYDVIVLFQYKRDFVNMVLAGQLIPNYLKLGCSALLGNEAAIFAAVLGAVGIGAATTGPISTFAAGLGAAAIAFPKL